MAYGSVAADQITTSVSGYSLGAGNSSLMKNKIINGAMVINQRGFSGTPANGAYTLDRYNVLMPVASKFTVAQSSTAPTGFVNSNGSPLLFKLGKAATSIVLVGSNPALFPVPTSVA